MRHNLYFFAPLAVFIYNKYAQADQNYCNQRVIAQKLFAFAEYQRRKNRAEEGVGALVNGNFGNGIVFHEVSLQCKRDRGYES